MSRHLLVLCLAGVVLGCLPPPIDGLDAGTGDAVLDDVSGDPASGDPASGDPASGDPASGDPASGDPGPDAAEGIWISPAELASLPTSGAAWQDLNSQAQRSIGSDYAWQANATDFDVNLLAAAYVAARTDFSGSLRGDVADAIMGWVDAYPGGSTDYSAAFRHTPPILVAADVIDFAGFRPNDELAFRTFVADLRFRCHGGKSIFQQMADRPNNHGTMAAASFVAISAYLERNGVPAAACAAGVPNSSCYADGPGQFSASEHQELCEDPALAIATSANILHAWLGDRSRYRGFDFSTSDLSGGDDWQCNENESYDSGTDNGFGVNPVGCTRAGHDISGILPDDQRRAGSFTWPPPKENYIYTALQGVMVTAVLLHRRGFDVWSWEDQAIERVWDTLHDVIDFPATDSVVGSDDGWLPYITNYYYGTSYPGSVTSVGKNMAWTAWTHGERP